MFSAHATNSIINLEAVKIWDVHGCEGVNKGFVSKNSKKKKDCDVGCNTHLNGFTVQQYTELWLCARF